MTNTYNIWN